MNGLTDNEKTRYRIEARYKMQKRYPHLDWPNLYVHHRDMDVENGRYSNLAIIQKKDHRAIHLSRKPYADSLKSELLVCLDGMFKVFLRVSDDKLHKQETSEFIDIKEISHIIFTNLLILIKKEV